MTSRACYWHSCRLQAPRTFSGNAKLRVDQVAHFASARAMIPPPMRRQGHIMLFRQQSSLKAEANEHRFRRMFIIEASYVAFSLVHNKNHDACSTCRRILFIVFFY